MKRTMRKSVLCGMILMLAGVLPALGSDAETTARATGSRLGPGTAAATARYEGDLGFARTDTRSGTVNIARGVAVGFDEDGLSLSFSTAIAPRLGPAFGTTFNMTLGSNGEVAHSIGTSVATGGLARTVSVGGSATSTHFGSTSTALAGGSTLGGGVVKASTTSDHYRVLPTVGHAAPIEGRGPVVAVGGRVAGRDDGSTRYVRTVHRVVRSR